MAWTKGEIEEARRKLAEMLNPGDIVYTILNNVSRDGMSRRLKVKVVKGGEVLDITRLAAKATVHRYNGNHEALVIGGCGMDMGFALVDSIMRQLGQWPELKDGRVDVRAAEAWQDNVRVDWL